MEGAEGQEEDEEPSEAPVAEGGGSPQTLPTPAFTSACAGDLGGCTFANISGNAKSLHLDQANAGSVFMVASQFNCLEFVSPHMTPEDGIAIYEGDRTQGPACSIACAPATVVRNYFAQDGQNAINTLQQTLAMLEESRDSTEAGSSPRQCVQVKGGYTFPTSDESLSELRQRFEAMGVFRHGKAGDNDNPVDLSCLETPSGTRSCTVECKMIPRLIDHRCLPDDA